MKCLSFMVLLVLVLVPLSSMVVATDLFPMEGGTLLPLEYMNTTGMIDLDQAINIGGQNYIAMEVSTCILENIIMDLSPGIVHAIHP